MNSELDFNTSTKTLQQMYEAEFGIQGSRIDNLSRDEMIIALLNGIASTKAPRRGSRH